MSKASKRQYINLEDDKITNIVNVLSSWDYTDNEIKEMIPYLAQLFKDNLIAIESTCLIISNLIDVTPFEDKIKEIYDGASFRYLLIDLLNSIKEEQYDELMEVVIQDTDNVDRSVYMLDTNTRFVTNFNTKKVNHVKDSNSKKAESIVTPVIGAVPKKLIVYDSPFLNLPRSFKIIWTSKYSERNFITTGDGVGATITEISQYLIDAGFGITNRLVKDAVTAMINSMIDDELVEIKTSIDNKGVYYNVEDDTILSVKLNIKEPSTPEMLSAIDTLNQLHEYYNNNDMIFATVFKWSLMSVFSYAMKQTGNWLPWLYLKGTAGSGKTTLAKIGLYLYGEPTIDNNISGSSFNTEYRFGEAISKDCTLRVVNEPMAVFKKPSTNEMVKHCVEGLIARKIKGKVVSAFSPVIFTANQYLPNDDALYRRLYVLSFTYSQRKTEKQKREFENKFHINSPNLSELKNLNVFGRFAIREVLTDPSLLSEDWQDVADKIINNFFDAADCLIPDWLGVWAESENLDDFDNSQMEDIRIFFVNMFNKARGSVDIRDEYGNRKNRTLDSDVPLTSDDFKGLNWAILNNRMIEYALPHVSRWNDKSICFTHGLKRELESNLEINTDLKSIAELLGWEYKNVNFGGKPKRVLKCDWDTFMEFVYPSGDVE